MYNGNKGIAQFLQFGTKDSPKAKVANKFDKKNVIMIDILWYI